MIKLFDFILENLINSGELRDKLSFNKISYKDFKQILFTKEYNFAKELGFKNEKEFDENVFLGNQKYTQCYKICYDDNILGIFQVYYCKQLDNEDLPGIYRLLLQDIFKGIEIKYDDYHKISDKSLYICTWQISKESKKNLDVNDFALVKVFFEKLIEFAKKDNIEYIIAHGKDEKLSKLYKKLGGFIDLVDIFNSKNFRKHIKNNDESYNNLVIKQI